MIADILIAYLGTGIILAYAFLIIRLIRCWSPKSCSGSRKSNMIITIIVTMFLWPLIPIIRSTNVRQKTVPRKVRSPRK